MSTNTALTQVSTYATLRTNYAVDPRATGLALSPGQVGWTTVRSFGAGGGGTHAFLTAGDGPLNLTTTVGSYLRKTWAVPPSTQSGANGSGFTCAAPSGNALSAFPVLPGQSLSLSGYLRPTSVSGTKIGQAVIIWYDSSGTVLATVGASYDVNGVLTAGGSTVVGATPGPPITCFTGQWTRVGGVFTVPVGASYALPVLDITGNPLWLAGDMLDGTALLLERTPAIDVYFDGTSLAPATTDLSYTWVGAANASVSIFRQIALLASTASLATFTPTASVTWGLGSYDNPDLQFNGVDRYGVEWICRVPDGWNKSTADTPILEGSGDGGWFSPGRRKPRVMTLTGAFRCGDITQMDAAETRLRAALEHVAEDQILWHSPLPTGASARQVTMRLTGDLSVDYVDANPRIRTFSAVLTAADPLKYAAGVAGLTTYTIWLPNTSGTNGLTFPAQFPLAFGTFNGTSGHFDAYNPGTMTVFPTVTFTGPLINPSLQALNQAATLGVSRTLAAGSVVVADTRNRSMLADGVSVFGQRFANCVFFPLLPGDNALYFTHTGASNGAATAVITFRPAWS